MSREQFDGDQQRIRESHAACVDKRCVGGRGWKREGDSDAKECLQSRPLQGLQEADKWTCKFF